jgi:hypothetical protein
MLAPPRCRSPTLWLLAATILPVLFAGAAGVDAAGRTTTVHMAHTIALYETGVKAGHLCGLESYLRMLVRRTRPSPTPRLAVLWVLNRTQVANEHGPMLDALVHDIDTGRRTRWRNKYMHRNGSKHEWRNATVGRASELRAGAVELLVLETSFAEIFADTPFVAWSVRTRLGRFRGQNFVNAARLAIVYKHGGMYADTDVLVVRDPLPLGDFVATQEHGCVVNNAPFQFVSPRSAYLAELMLEFVRGYAGDVWGRQGPYLWSRVMLARCARRFCKLTRQQCRDNTCRGNKEGREDAPWCDKKMLIAAPAMFAPLDWMETGQLLLADHAPPLNLRLGSNSTEGTVTCPSGSSLIGSNPHSYMHHLWDKARAVSTKKLRKTKTDPEEYRRSSLGRIRQCLCPTVASELTTFI